jgi:hypothetical protein
VTLNVPSVIECLAAAGTGLVSTERTNTAVNENDPTTLVSVSDVIVTVPFPPAGSVS